MVRVMKLGVREVGVEVRVRLRVAPSLRIT